MSGRELELGDGVELRGLDVLHRGRVFDVVRASLRLPSGLAQELDVVLHGGAAAVAALADDGRLLCVRQHRASIGRDVLEIPAGRLEAGEDPLAAAKRELEEETGHRARNWTLLRRFHPAVGFCSEAMFLYLAEGLEAVQGGGLAADADEELAVELASAEDLLASEPGDAKTLVAAFEVLRRRG